MMQIAEKELRHNQNSRRIKRIERLKSQTNPKREYNEREFYVEGKIEKTFKTYDMNKNDLKELKKF